jgi:histidine phosphotransferase ChpT
MEFSGSDHTGPEIALIEQSCAAAAARIEFFRIACGAAVSGQDISHRETIHIGNNLFENTRIKVQWYLTEDLPRNEIQLVFLMLQCFESALPFGGSIAPRRANGRWQMTCEEARLRSTSLYGRISRPPRQPTKSCPRMCNSLC